MALGTATFANAGGAVSDLFAAEGFRYKAKGAKFEKDNYELAATLAGQNAQYTHVSTAIKNAQQDRDLFRASGQTRADIAGAGFAQSGSALDILRDSAAQGALAHAVTTQQGLITEAGYKEQQQSYQNMSKAADVAIDAANFAATGAEISGAIKGVTALATLAI